MRLPQGSRKSRNGPSIGSTPAAFKAPRAASLSSTTRPKCRPSSADCLRPAFNAMNWSLRSMKDHRLALTAQLKAEDATIEFQRFLYITDLQRHVVETDGAR